MRTAAARSRRDRRCPQAGARRAGLRVLRYGVLPVTALTVGRVGAEQVRRTITTGPGAQRGKPGGNPAAPRIAGPGRGESRAPQEQTSTQLSARHGGCVTRQPPARLRPAAICQPTALLHVAAAARHILSLLWQASMQRRIAVITATVVEGARHRVQHRASWVAAVVERYKRDGRPALACSDPGHAAPSAASLPDPPHDSAFGLD